MLTSSLVRGKGRLAAPRRAPELSTADRQRDVLPHLEQPSEAQLGSADRLSRESGLLAGAHRARVTVRGEEVLASVRWAAGLPAGIKPGDRVHVALGLEDTAPARSSAFWNLRPWKEVTHAPIGR